LIVTSFELNAAASDADDGMNRPAASKSLTHFGTSSLNSPLAVGEDDLDYERVSR
jgi:hypothetical protein